MQKIVIGNWKMNPEDMPSAIRLFAGIKRGVSKIRKVKVVICPSFAHIGKIAGGTPISGNIALGAQDVFWGPSSGSFTGEVSAVMLKRLGVRYVIIGHSERRQLGETDSDVQKKVRAALSAGLTPVVCIGEHERDSAGLYLATLEQQINASLGGLKKTELATLIVAYEPLWAIGKTAQDAITPHTLHETSLFIRKILAEMYDKATALKVSVLYGGSVEPSNTSLLAKGGDINGFLVGHKSLDAKAFADIVRATAV